MGRRWAFLAAVALGCATGLAASAPAQHLTAPCLLCAPSHAIASDRLETPVTLEVATRLDFDRLILAGAGAGSAELRPDGSRAVIGSV